MDTGFLCGNTFVTAVILGGTTNYTPCMLHLFIGNPARLEVKVMTLTVMLLKIEMLFVICSLSEERSVYVSPAEPRFYEFKFTDGIETVLLRVDSDDDICMTVSIQNMSVSYVVI